MLHTSLPLIPAQIIAQHFGLADSGATGHFFTADARVINKQINLDPLKVKIPDRDIRKSIHTCELDLPKLPIEARRGHNDHTLLSIPHITLTCMLKVGAFGYLVQDDPKVSLSNVGCIMV
jgi:hypothetical protein